MDTTATQPRILIIEDVEDHYEDIKLLVDKTIAGIEPRPLVERVDTKDALKQRVAALENLARVLIIFDLHIDKGKDGQKEDMTSFVRDLSQAPAQTWHGTVGIIVYSALPHTLARLPKRHRQNIDVIGKYPKGDREPFKDLEAAIVKRVGSLLEPVSGAGAEVG